jgi:hypothetical protein
MTSYKLFPQRESLVNDAQAGDGNIEKLFLRCRAISLFRAAHIPPPSSVEVIVYNDPLVGPRSKHRVHIFLEMKQG